MEKKRFLRNAKRIHIYIQDGITFHQELFGVRARWRIENKAVPCFRILITTRSELDDWIPQAQFSGSFLISNVDVTLDLIRLGNSHHLLRMALF